MKKIEIICGIYKLTNPSGKVYIGQSGDIHNTWKVRYKNSNCKGQPLLYNSIRKYGWESHKSEIIHVCSFEQLNELEIYYSTLFNSRNRICGLNIRECGSNGRHSEESKKLISEAIKKAYRENPELGRKSSDRNRGKIVTPETRKKISDSLIGKSFHSQEFKDKMAKKMTGNKWALGYKLSDKKRAILSMIQKGKTMSQEAVEKTRQANLGRKCSDEAKRKLSEINKKISLNLETGIFYFGAKEVAEQMNVSDLVASRRLNGRTKNKTSYSYV